jgi:hypothetical protein
VPWGVKRGVASLAACFALTWLVASPASANTYAATEGQSLGSATQPVVLGTTSFDALTPPTINWGDGKTDTCQLNPIGTNPPCSWSQTGEFSGVVYGYHTYAEQDAICLFGVGCQRGQPVPYGYTVTFQSGQPVTGTVSVADAPLTGFAQTGTPLVNVAAPVTVAKFIDVDQGEPPADYVASIDWGDHSPSDTNTRIVPATVNGQPGFAVQGTHAYAASGTYSAKVTIQDSEALRVSSGPITVSSTLTASSSGVESQSLYEGVPFSGLIAQFCSPPGTVTSASVNWGDGTALDTSTTVNAVANNCYQVTAGHTYSEETTNSHTVTVTPTTSSGSIPPVTGTADVSDAPLSATLDSSALTAGSLDLPASVIAHVTDANTVAPPCANGGPCDLTAKVTWGDGTPGTGVLSPDPSGGFDVTAGPHTFPGPGTYTIAVSVTDKGGSTIAASGTYTINPPPALTTGCNSPVPAIGATTGLYGGRLDPHYQPNWGISSDDRVLRFGNVVLCAEDAPWTYRGTAPLAHGAPIPYWDPLCLFRCKTPYTGGVFQTTGKVTVNGIELSPFNLQPITVDTWAGSITGPSDVTVNPTSHAGTFGSVNLTATPWILDNHNTVAYMPASSNAYLAGLNLTGNLHIRVDGLGTSAIDGYMLLPNVFSLRAYAGGPPSSPITIHEHYPGVPGKALDHPAPDYASTSHAAGDPCSYPPSNAPIQLTSPDLYLGGIEMHCAYIYYDPSTGDALGGGGFGIGPVYADGFLKLQHDAFAGAGGGVTGLNVPIAPAVNLQSIHFSVFLDPSRFHAQAGLAIAGGLAELDGGTLVAFATNDHPYGYDWDKPITGQDDIPGTSSILDSNPFTSFTIGAGGSFQPLDLPLHVHGYALYSYPAYVEFGGAMDASVLGGAVSFNANLQGQFWLNDRDFNIEGGLNLCLPDPIGCNGISGILSSKGVIGCFNLNVFIGTISIGGGYKWGDGGPSIYLSGCTDNFGSYRVSSAADVAQATGARTYVVRKGLPAVMFKLSGTGGSPAFTVTGPRGESATAGPDNEFSGSRQIVILRMHQFDTTWVGIEHPAGGSWRLTPLPGSAPIASTSIAPGVPPASVHAQVTGTGYHRALRFTIRPRPGQTVQFVEIGHGASQSLGIARGVRGTLRFTPAIGPGGRREIVALVFMGGVPATRLVVASYRAPGPPRAGRPAGLRLARRGSTLQISWRRSANSTGYQIVVIGTDGQRMLLVPPASAHGVSVSGFALSGATVEVVGIGPDGNTGPMALARLRPAPPPARVRRLAISRHRKQIRISWGPASGAALYRVILVLSGTPAPVGLDTTQHGLTFTAPSVRTAVRVSVRAEGPLGSLGPEATTRLAG